MHDHKATGKFPTGCYLQTRCSYHSWSPKPLELLALKKPRLIYAVLVVFYAVLARFYAVSFQALFCTGPQGCLEVWLPCFRNRKKFALLKIKDHLIQPGIIPGSGFHAANNEFQRFLGKSSVVGQRRFLSQGHLGSQQKRIAWQISFHIIFA